MRTWRQIFSRIRGGSSTDGIVSTYLNDINNKFGWNFQYQRSSTYNLARRACSIRRKDMISFWPLTQHHDRSRTNSFRLGGHGLSNEEKKNTGDNFKLHLELVNSRKHCSSIYTFFSFLEHRSWLWSSSYKLMTKIMSSMASWSDLLTFQLPLVVSLKRYPKVSICQNLI